MKKLFSVDLSLLLGVGTILLLLLTHTWVGPDIWYHLSIGRSVWQHKAAMPPNLTVLNQPGFVNFYWFFQLVIYLIYDFGGNVLLSLFFMLLWCLIARNWFRVVRPTRAGIVGVFLSLLSLIIVQRRFEERPEILAYFILGLQIRWALMWNPNKKLNSKKLIPVFLSEIVVSSVHGYFLFGPAIFGLKAVCSFLDKSKPKASEFWSNIVFVIVGLFACTIVTPLGVDNWRGVMALAEILHSPAAATIAEFRRLPLRYPQDYVFWGTWLVTLFAAIERIRKGSRYWFSSSLCLVGVALSADVLRNLPLLVLFSAPLWRVSLREVKLKKKFVLPLRIFAGASIAIIAAMVVTNEYYEMTKNANTFGIGISKELYPHKFVEYGKTQNLKGPVFNDPNYGGFLEYHLPETKLYSDSRYCNSELVFEYFNSLTNPDNFLALNNRFHFSGVILDAVQSKGLVTPLLRHPDWVLAYADVQNAYFSSDKQIATDLRFFRGENLTVTPYHHFATTWLINLADAGRNDLMLLAIKQLANQDKIPASVMGVALQYSAFTKDPEMISAAKALRSRLWSQNPAEIREIDEFMKQ